MKNHIAFKFLAVLLCAVTLLGAVGSAGGILVLTQMDLFNKTVDQVVEEEVRSDGESYANILALRCASRDLGGCPEDMIRNRYNAYWFNDSYDPDYYGYTVLDAEGNVLDSYNRYLYLLFIFLLSAVATLLVDRFNPDSIYFIPYSIIAIYLMAFFKKRVVMPAYIMSLIPLLLFTNGGEGLFMMHLVAGMVCIFTFSYFNHGWLQFVNAIFIFISASLVLLTNRLINGDPNLFDYSELLKIFIGSLACWLGYPMIFLFEKLFNLVSNSRLQDLCDTNSKLLQLLAQKAPGTFQHCLQVMNLSDAAARSIGANVLLTRAGALYHDIGKMENPLCFVENQTPGVKYHEELSAEESARDIIKHVSDGVAIADRYRLPDEIKQFIVTHHGTSCAAYFLTKYLNAGGDPDKTDTFYYKGQVPSTKEQSIVMVCDTLEAASRTLTDFSRNAVSDFVDRVFSSKLKEGQFADSALTEREIGIIKSTLKEYIANMHHARIVYPKRKGGSKERF